MNDYDELSSKDCRSNPYDDLPFEEGRLVARWRAVTTAVAAATLLGIFGVLAMLNDGDDPQVAAALPAANVAAAPGKAPAPAVTARDGAGTTASTVLARRRAASVAALGS